MKKILQKAIKLTIPVFAGYLILGMAFGMLLADLGYHPIYATIMSTFVYAGSGQYLAITLLANHIDLISVFILSFIINLRHIFYGISMLKKFSGLGRLKFLAIFTLTDETFSILSSLEYEEKEKKPLFISISILNHLYWIFASTLGAFLFQYIKITTKGMDFVLTALFIVIMLNQIEKQKNKYLPFIGIGTTLLCYLLFRDNFILPTLSILLILITLLRKPFSKLEEEKDNA